MRNLIFILTVVILSGCASFMEADQKRWAARCQNYGFEKGTPDFARCMQEEERRAWDIASDSWQRASDSFKPAPTQTAPSTVNCTSYGTYSSCTGY